MENSIYAIESKSVAMKILRENIIWHWFHFIEETKRYETNQNETKEMKTKRRKKKKKYMYNIYKSCVCVCVYVFPYSMHDGDASDGIFKTVISNVLCYAVAYKRKHIVTHTHAKRWQVVRSSMIARVQEILAFTHEITQFKYRWLFLHRFKNYSLGLALHTRPASSWIVVFNTIFVSFFSFVLHSTLRSRCVQTDSFLCCCCTHGHWA